MDKKISNPNYRFQGFFIKNYMIGKKLAEFLYLWETISRLEYKNYWSQNRIFYHRKRTLRFVKTFQNLNNKISDNKDTKMGNRGGEFDAETGRRNLEGNGGITSTY